jgi:stage III sporulation protein AH
MKHLKLWKRNAIVVAIVLFVCGAVYMNWSYNKQDTEAGKTLGEAALVGGKSSGEANQDADKSKDSKKTDGKKTDGKKTESSYFSEARLNRQQARDSALSLLQEAAKDEKATKETIQDANLAIQTMANYTLTEAQIENLVVAKGYTNCVAFLSDNSISVVVSGVENALADTDVAKIGEIVMEQTGLKADQIKIIQAD